MRSKAALSGVSRSWYLVLSIVLFRFCFAKRTCKADPAEIPCCLDEHTRKVRASDGESRRKPRMSANAVEQIHLPQRNATPRVEVKRRREAAKIFQPLMTADAC